MAPTRERTMQKCYQTSEKHYKDKPCQNHSLHLFVFDAEYANTYFYCTYKKSDTHFNM